MHAPLLSELIVIHSSIAIVFVYPLTTQESNDQQMLLIHKFKWIVVRTCTSCSQWLCMQMPGSPHNAL